MATDQKRAQADARFARNQKRAERAEEGKKALTDHEIEAARVNANTKRLRELRLAKEAADREKPISRVQRKSRIKSQSEV